MNHLPEKVVNKSILTNDLNQIIDKLEQIKLGLYKSSAKARFSDEVDSLFTFHEKEFLSRELLDAGDGINAVDELEKFVEQLIHKLRNMENLNLILSFEPTVEMTSKLLEGLQDKVKSPVVVKVDVDPSIIAGVIIEYAGKYGDFSIKNDVEGII